MSEKNLRVLWLYPDILNLHGDRGNAMALVRVAGQLGLGAEVRRVTRLADEVDLDWANMLLLNSGELAVMTEVVRALSNEKLDVEKYSNAGGAVFCTGTAGAALARETERADGGIIQGLGLLGMRCRERAEILGDDVIFRTEEVEEAICGIQIQMVDSFLDEGQAPFGGLLYGHGNNGRAHNAAHSGEGPGGGEGAIRKNITFTNALGPVLVKNPWLTLHLIERALGTPLAPEEKAKAAAAWGLERKSSEAIRAFNEKKARKE
jgi:CobQ-like glutamine amidotransferase family enzyme